MRRQGTSKPTQLAFSGLALCVVSCFACVATARAQLSTEHPSSVLMYPRVVSDSSTETYVELTNSSNSGISARCFYSGAAGAPVLHEFSIDLPRSMATHWVVSLGRPVDPNDPPCSPENDSCSGAGLDPGEIPAVVEGFRGQLLCVETDRTGSPAAGNHLLGSATQVTRATGDITRYAALGSVGLETAADDPILCLGAADETTCPLGAEFAACPLVWTLDVRPDDLALAGEGNPRSRTQITIVPCSQNLATGAVMPVQVNVLALTTLGTQFATSIQIDAWTDVDLSAIDAGLTAVTLGDAVVQLRVRSLNGHGLFVLGGERLEGAGAAAVAVQPAHAGIAFAGDLITLPALGEPVGVAAGGAR